jgi:hypothetical protein
MKNKTGCTGVNNDKKGEELTAILEEAGFVHTDANWLPRQPIAAELVPVV